MPPPESADARTRAHQILTQLAEEGPGKSSRDPERGLAGAIVRTTVRRWLTIRHLIRQAGQRDPDTLEPVVCASVLGGVAELVCLDGTPDPIVVDAHVESIRPYRPGATKLVNAILRRVIDLRGEKVEQADFSDPSHIPLGAGHGWQLSESISLPGEDPLAILAVRSGMPRGLIRRWAREQGLEEATRVYQRVMSRDPNGYYAVYAKQRLFELAEDVAPGRDPAETLASLGALRFATTDRRPAGYEPQTTQAPLRRAPHHGAAFAWDSPTGKRALRLMTLGFLGDATDLVRRVPAISGADQEHVHFARARLLYSLGDYHAAYRIALVHLRDRVAEGYSPALRRTFEMLYPRAHPALVNAAATEWGVPELFLLSVIRQESAFDDRARSWVSARGLMQIIPPTASRIADALQFEDFHPGLLNDPEINVRFGGWYLKALLD
ncbi:MAG: transglycosylase SLT domain-containing protein, partial [Planctomycetota bacterium]